MWTIGHCCLAYIVSRPLFGKKPLKPGMLITIFLMANILDFAHVYILRTMTHSLIFFIPFISSVLLVLIRLEIISKNIAIPLFVAASTHVIADSLFGSFIPFYPLSSFKLGFYGWSSYLDYIIEIALFAVMLAIMKFTGDLKSMSDVKNLSEYGTKWIEHFHNIVLLLLILGIFAQIGGLFYLDILGGQNFYNEAIYNDGSLWFISIAFMATMAVFAFILVRWGLLALDAQMKKFKVQRKFQA